MSEHEREAESPDEPREDDSDELREAQQGTGYGEDEGERDAGLERETGWAGGDDTDETADPDR